MPTLAFALTGDIRMNSRALKQFRVWTDIGWRIEAFGFGAGESPQFISENIRLHLLPKPKGGGIRFFRAAHILFKSALRTALKDVPIDVYHASDLYVLPAMAHARKQRLNAKLTFDSRELYPYVAATEGRPWVSLFWNALSSRYLPQCDAVFTVSESIAERLAVLYDIPKPPVLYNVPDVRLVSPSNYLRKSLSLSSEMPIILHQGKMQMRRGCELLVNAMQEIQDAALVFLGDGAFEAALKKQVADLGLENVYFVPPVPPSELLSVTAGADFGVTLLEDSCLNHHFALPNKLFEYLSVGIPVLASDLPEIAKVVQGYDVGMVVNPHNAADLVLALQTMTQDATKRNQWKQNAPKVFLDYNWEQAAEILKKVYLSFNLA